ncbi:hypothetical protein BC826DRAFT_972593 [Russula brevipes]|nr:hypothetical protein BC826DRAFT_972593 [Russula brevipes]
MGSYSHWHARKRVRHQVSAMTSSVSPSLLPNIPGLSILQLLIRDHSVYRPGETGDWGRRRRQVTIDTLPDDVLLEIFDVYADKNSRGWPKLLHVCRRWRSVVLASTRRLNLQLRCTYKTPARKMLDIWPALPIVIKDSTTRAKGADNIVAALGHPDRVRRIELEIPESDLYRFAAEMRDPFPELTFLYLGTIKKETVFVLPDSFLGGSAPRLRVLRLYGIPFPAVPKLLSSASGLVDLHLLGIPHSGYVSPEAMVTCLSALTRLEWLHIQFRSPRSRPDQPSPPRSIRTVLPSLTSFLFRGVSEYLEDLTSRIDAPLLSDLNITFFNQLIFNTPRLCSFISDAEKLRSRSQAHMTFDSDSVELSLTTAGRPKGLKLGIRCEGSDWQLSALTQFFCIHDYTGKMWRTHNGWNFYIHLPP